MDDAALDAAAFLGDWRIERRIDDRRDGREGRFEGQARFETRGPDVLRYDESGTLRMAGVPPMRAERAYVWRFEAGCVAVTFADGRPFHRFLPGGAGAGTDHPCGADLYQVTYDFTGWPAWSSRWAVQGPSKDYVMWTAYARPAAGGEACATPGLGANITR